MVTLDMLLRPDGRPLKAFLYVLAFAFAVRAGELAQMLQRYPYDYFEMGIAMMQVVVAPVLILGVAFLISRACGPRVNVPIALAASILVGHVALAANYTFVTVHVLGLDGYPYKAYWYKPSFPRLAIWGLAAAAWYVSQRARLRAEELHRAMAAASELQASTAEARLNALQAQVEPHFLFNTLAHVRWLYGRDPQQGRRMLDRFLEYLKAALPHMRQSAPTLGEELNLAHAYLDIQQLRIGSRLEFSIEVTDEMARQSFPPMMLITLVENAIKHGIGPLPQGGTVRIRGLSDGARLRIEVRDTGQGLRQGGGAGIGLANIRARLSGLFGTAARLVIEPNDPCGVTAAIEIPR